MRPEREIELVRDLIHRGHSDLEISRLTGIPRRTVYGWRHRPRRSPSTDERRAPWLPSRPAAYAYLLGIYLGDGHVTVRGRSSMLRVYCDLQYPELMARAEDAMRQTIPGVNVRRYDAPGVIVLQAWSAEWPRIFPQHGPGRKHTRKIELAPWQRAIVETHPCEFLRGLIHSDGCRAVNRFGVDLPSGRRARYEYVRYFFTNLSGDIRGLFCWACALVGVRTSNTHVKHVSVSDRRSVAILESFIGPKA